MVRGRRVRASTRRGRCDFARELERRRLRLPFECISRAERIDDDGGRRARGAGLLARVDRIGERLAAHARRDAAPRQCRTGRRRRGAAAPARDSGGHVHHARLRRRAGQRPARHGSTISSATAPDIFLTTVSYPIKGTPYYDRVADRIESPGPWAIAPIEISSSRGGRPGATTTSRGAGWSAKSIAHRHWRTAVRALDPCGIVGAGRADWHEAGRSTVQRGRTP